jgi:uncharacterized protein YqcC (DUF446 family)
MATDAANRARAGELALAIEAEMRRTGWWRSAPEAPVVGGAFGQPSMSFTEWIETVLVPRLRQVAAGEIDPPNSSYVAVAAAREIDNDDEAGPLLELLSRVDRLSPH